MKVVIAFCLLIGIFLCLVIFKTCTNSISFIDGDRKSKMVKLAGDYYYNKVDGAIWVREMPTDSYKRVLQNEVDSLIFNKKNIVGYSKDRYFKIEVFTGKISYMSNLYLNHTDSTFGQISYDTVKGVSSLRSESKYLIINTSDK
jgi:hypothetical protein